MNISKISVINNNSKMFKAGERRESDGVSQPNFKAFFNVSYSARKYADEAVEKNVKGYMNKINVKNEFEKAMTLFREKLKGVYPAGQEICFNAKGRIDQLFQPGKVDWSKPQHELRYKDKAINFFYNTSRHGNAQVFADDLFNTFKALQKDIKYPN